MLSFKNNAVAPTLVDEDGFVSCVSKQKKRMSNMNTPAKVAPVKHMNVSSAAAAVHAASKYNTPFCATCMKVGKSKEEYTSHFTKSSSGPDGVVTCPTILNAICSYCKQKGHFKNSCGEIARKKNIASAAFAAAFESIEKEAEVKAEETKFIVETSVFDDEFPSLGGGDCCDNNNNYASILSVGKKSMPTYSSVVASKVSAYTTFKISFEDDYTPEPPKKVLTKRKRDIHHSWADDEYWNDESDSDEE